MNDSESGAVTVQDYYVDLLDDNPEEVARRLDAAIAEYGS